MLHEEIIKVEGFPKMSMQAQKEVKKERKKIYFIYHREEINHFAGTALTLENILGREIFTKSP